MQSYFEQITETLLMQSYAILFFVSFVLCLVVILASGYGFHRRAELDAVAVRALIVALSRELAACLFILVYWRSYPFYLLDLYHSQLYSIQY